MTTLTCDQARLHFSDLLAGALSAADAADLDGHLAQCSACRAQAGTGLAADSSGTANTTCAATTTTAAATSHQHRAMRAPMATIQAGR